MSAASLTRDLPLERRRSSRAKVLRLEVRHPGLVVLTMPQRCSVREADAFLAQHAQWIHEQLSKLQRNREQVPTLTQPRWDGEDQIRIRDRLIPLRYTPVRARRAELRLDAAAAELCAPVAWQAHPERLTRALRRELREEARMLAEYWLAEEIPRIGLRPSGLRIGDQRSLWGSCAADGRLSFNWRLLMAPDAVFRYVVIHELAHLRHRNHSAHFWSLVAQQMPDYEQHRHWLRQCGHELQYVLPPINNSYQSENRPQ